MAAIAAARTVSDDIWDTTSALVAVGLGWWEPRRSASDSGFFKKP